MAEACPDNRRCLPAWMMKPCSSNEVSKAERRNKQAAESDKQSGALDQTKPIRRRIKIVDTEDAKALQRCQGKEKVRRKSKDADSVVTDEFDEIEKITRKNERKVSGRAAPKNSRKRVLEDVGSDASSSGITDDERELSAGSSRALQRCQGREKTRRKRDGADYSAKDELEEIEATRKNVIKVSGRAAPKNRKQKPDNVGSEALSSGTTDDEIELTVEDLVSIAEEIVNADKEKLQDIRTTKKARNEERPPRPPVSTPADTGGSVSSTWSTKGLMQCTAATTTDETPSECRVDKNKRHEEPERPPIIKMTGDVAEDMMNILLGPLWNSEPAAYENKPEAVVPRTVNVNLAPRRKNDWQKTVAQVQGAPVVKKKSSLKDMVAFFLD